MHVGDPCFKTKNAFTRFVFTKVITLCDVNYIPLVRYARRLISRRINDDVDKCTYTINIEKTATFLLNKSHALCPIAYVHKHANIRYRHHYYLPINIFRHYLYRIPGMKCALIRKDLNELNETERV